MWMKQNESAKHGETVTMKKATRYGASTRTMRALALPCRTKQLSSVPNPAWNDTQKIA